MGLGSADPRMMIPYSVSRPSTFTMATGRPYRRPWPSVLQVLPGGDPFDRSAAGRLLTVGHQRPHVDDPFALLPGDLGPVVGVGGVRQILVFLVLLFDGGEEVVGADASALAR